MNEFEKNKIKQRLIKSHEHINKSGGQTVSVCHSKVTIYSPDLDISISVGINRSQIRNADIAYKLMYWAIDDIVK